jgi:hypothetical protein
VISWERCFAPLLARAALGEKEIAVRRGADETRVLKPRGELLDLEIGRNLRPSAFVSLRGLTGP